MCGDTPLLINFVYGIDLGVANLIYLCILFVYLFGYCELYLY